MILKKVLTVSLILLSSCAHSKGAEERLDIKIYAGDPEKKAIVRAQSGDTIPVESPNFSEYGCISFEDWKKVYSYVFGCRYFK